MNPNPSERVINWADTNAENFNRWDAYDIDKVVKIVIGPSPDWGGEVEPLEIDLRRFAEWLPKFKQVPHLHLWNVKGLDTLPPLPPGLKCLDLRGSVNSNLLSR